MSTISCPECDANVPVGSNVLAGELIVCPECEAELEIVQLTPLVVELAPEVEEDWGE